MLKLAKAKQAEAAARKSNAQAILAEQRTNDLSTRAAEREEKARNKANKATKEAQREYKKLTAEYRQLVNAAEDAGAALGTNSQQYIEAAKRANEARAVIDKIDQGLGNFQRNVGNYASGFSGLSNSLNQITRELPAFANSVQTGFLAISNNLPIFFDEISKVKKEIVELRKAGQPAPSLFKAVAGSFFTLGTALSLGVTALTIYGPQLAKFIQSLFQGKQALDRFAESQRILGETLKSGGLVEAAASVAELRINIDLAKQGFLDKDKVVKQYNESIGKTTGEVKSLEEAEKSLQKNADAYIKMTYYKAAAQLSLQEAAKKSLQAEIDRQKNLDEFVNNFDRARATIFTPTAPGFVPINNEAQRQADEYRKKKAQERQRELVKESEDEADIFIKIGTKFQKKAAEASKKLNFDFFGGTQDNKKSDSDRLKTVRAKIFTAELEDFKNQLKALSDSEELSIRSRQNFRKEAAAIERKLLKDTAAFEIQLEKDKLQEVLTDKDASATAKINAQNEYAARTQEIERELSYNLIKSNKETEFALLKIKDESLERQLKQYEEEYKELVSANKKKEEEQDRFNKAQEDIDLQGLSNSFQESIAILDQNFAKIDRKRKDFPEIERKYNEDRLKIQEEYQIKALESQIKFAEQQLAIEKLRALGIKDDETRQRIELSEKNLASLRISLSKLVADTQINQSRRVSEAENEDLQKRLENIRRVGQTTISFLSAFGEIANIGDEREKNRIQEQIELIEEKKRREIEAINATALSEEEKAARIKVIEAQTAARREQLELRQRQLEQRKARFQKAISVATIIASTAEAVVAALGSKPYTPGNIALAAFSGALGAAQLATVIATPIPRYKHGIYGSNSHPGGLALINDGGKQEVIVEPGEEPYLQRKMNFLSELPKGTQVYPDVEVFNRMNSMELRSHLPVTSQSHPGTSDKLLEKQIRATRELGRIISSKKETHFHWSNGELKKSVSKGTAWTNYLNSSVFD
ncbi:hypothetical protein [Flavihumibacter sp. CACIAM 22H1]|uniref:hypothetical protein n=1 Tax=Flavihumibacter sp. CACIAM 22H1 TaxID=1812911 RepID=UPI0025B96BA7|nr:hypothetical protein [Flavihumibacter sp. CACIAM 22H1]